MATKKDKYYFESFISAAECSCNAAKLLTESMAHFSKDKLVKSMNDIHAAEHAADNIKHDLMSELLRAFITPIEREDIMKLSQNIDDVTDAIDDIAIRLYINNVAKLRTDSLPFVELLEKCCETMKMLLVELPDFKKSKRIKDMIIEMNRLEEEGDKLYITAMHTLHTESDNPLEIISWREIYDCLEKACDACEHVANVVESIIIGNT